MIESATACDDGLLRREPRVRGYALGDQRAGFDIRGLNIDRADAELLVSKQALECFGWGAEAAERATPRQ